MMKNLIVLLAVSIIGLCSTTPVNGATLEQVKKTQVQKALGTSQGVQIKNAVAKYSKMYNVEPALIHAIILTESGYNVTATSPCGAKGLMQLMPMTFNARKVGGSIYNIDQNIHAGTKHISGLIALYEGDIYKALGAYNYGGGRIKKGQPLPAGAKKYVDKVYYHKTIVNGLI